MAAGGRTATTAATSILIISTSLLPSLHGVASAQGFVHLHVPQHHHHHLQPPQEPEQQQQQQPFGTAPTRSNNLIGTRSTNTGRTGTRARRTSTAEKAQAHAAAAGAEAEAEAEVLLLLPAMLVAVEAQ